MPDPDERPDDVKPPTRLPLEWVRPAWLVFEFLGYLAVLGYVGAWLDEHYHWQPWGLLGGLLLGLAVGVYRMIREEQKLER